MEVVVGLIALVWWVYFTVWLVNIHSLLGDIEQSLRQQKAIQQDLVAALEKLQKGQ